METSISRRAVIRLLGGGSLCLAAAVVAGPRGTTAAEQRFSPQAWLEIDAESRVLLRVKKCEMGQQIHTAIVAIVADELGVDIADITVEQAATEDDLGYIGTGGSYATPGFWQLGRPLVAAAREMLARAAADAWGVAPEAVDIRDGRVVHGGSGHAAAIGEFAAAASSVPVPRNPSLRDPARYRYIGKLAGRRDAAAVLDGTAQFGADLRLPGLRYAVLSKSPARGTRLKQFDAEAALRVPGIDEIVRLGESVAVVATTTWAALSGCDALAAEWEKSPHADVDNDAIRRALGDAMTADGVVVRAAGQASAGAPHRAIDVVYEMPMAQHAAIEPVTATALVDAGRCTVWAPVQMATLARREIAAALGMAPDAVTVHTTIAGGSFGRKLEREYAIEAARLAERIDGPVQLVYSREDDMRFGGVRPPSRHRLRLGRDTDTGAMALDYVYAAASTFAQQDPAQVALKGYDWTAALGAVDIPYAFDTLRVRQVDVELAAVPLNWWRGTYRNHHAFAVECAMDEFAAENGVDPLQLRLALLDRDLEVETFPDEMSRLDAARLREVLTAAAERAGYGSVGGPGRAVGLACHSYTDVDTYVAHAVDVTVDDGSVRINRVCAAIDCGIAVVPDAVEAQLEGSVVFGLSSAFWGDVAVAAGAIETVNFDRCRILRLHETPPIDVDVVNSGASPGGVGEPPLPSVTPALLNAIARAGGPRIRRLPIGDAIRLRT